MLNIRNVDEDDGSVLKRQLDFHINCFLSLFVKPYTPPGNIITCTQYSPYQFNESYYTDKTHLFIRIDATRGK